MASIRGFPNGATRRPSWAGTEPCCSGGTQGSETSQYLQAGILRESWRAKADQTKPWARDTRRGLRSWCCGSVCPGSDGPGGSHKTACQGNRLEGLAAEGASPVPGSLPSSDHVSQVARASWNPV